MKRYYMQYESDKVECGSNNHHWGSANSINACKGYIRKCRKEDAEKNPRNFRVYDSFADVLPETGFVPCVYFEA